MDRISAPLQPLPREAPARAPAAIIAEPAQAKPATSTRIEGLDGLRALSIIVVLIGHGAGSAGHPQWMTPLHTVGVIGVELFFAISGFIITYLMVREHQRTGGIQLGHFWARRALRILPPLAAMMAGFAAASAAGIFPWSWPSFAGAASFTRNLAIPGLLWGPDWFFGHTWSLSLEEQFYVAWPPLFVLFYARRDLARGLLIAIAAAPVIALICEFGWVPVRNLLPFLPYLAAGCLLALLMHRDDSPLLRRIEALPHRATLLGLLAAPACVVSWLRNQHWTPWLWVPLDAILMPAAVFLLLSETVRHHGRWTRLLSSKPLRVLGLWSYSVYLWQQLFFGPPEVYAHPWFWSTWPFNLPIALLCGALSYWLIERSCGRLKSRLHLG